jgi:hypothetical protein
VRGRLSRTSAATPTRSHTDAGRRRSRPRHRPRPPTRTPLPPPRPVERRRTCLVSRPAPSASASEVSRRFVEVRSATSASGRPCGSAPRTPRTRGHAAAPTLWPTASSSRPENTLTQTLPARARACSRARIHPSDGPDSGPTTRRRLKQCAFGSSALKPNAASPDRLRFFVADAETGLEEIRRASSQAKRRAQRVGRRLGRAVSGTMCADLRSGLPCHKCALRVKPRSRIGPAPSTTGAATV